MSQSCDTFLVMDFSEVKDLPITRIKVRALVKCGNNYAFIQRKKHGKTKTYLVFPGGKVKKSDRVKGDKENLGAALHAALVRELEEELAAKDIVIKDFLGYSKTRKHYKELLFFVEAGSIDWENRTGREFTNPNKGDYYLVLIEDLTKDLLGKKGYHLKPREWRKLLYRL